MTLLWCTVNDVVQVWIFGGVTLLRCTVDVVMQVWMCGGVTLLRCTVDVVVDVWRLELPAEFIFNYGWLSYIFG